MNIQEFLGRNNIPFEVLEHDETFEAQRMAHAVHVSGHHVAKTVLLRIGEGDEFVVVVLPASRKIDLDEARKAFHTENLDLATEHEISSRCPDCAVGALPPFGSQYNLKTVVDKSLTEDDQIVFEGHLHSESIRMKYDDFARLENPEVMTLSFLPVPDEA